MMSTSQVSAVDRENSAAHLGIHEKHHLLGPQKKWGEHQARGTPVQKHFEGSSTNLQKSHRSFGEISNILDRGSEGSRSEVHKKVPHQPSALSPSSEEPELIQVLPRREDHSDIFPPSLLMSHDQLANFTYFWKSCQKPDLQSLQISSSPPRDLAILPIMNDAEKVIPEVVPEDLFHLPPPWE
ncbi:uncharacterized protein LOC123498089 [Portunus trituberculatus]|uniref:uncharacterized protein LOC123498089 n=1 Tax=Portunus trituberculatus TaxID=210409 RepID=UPI001E1CE4C5|nr:uncharacterized protein LOC123498089 [Portunus trituberculatus]